MRFPKTKWRRHLERNAELWAAVIEAKSRPVSVRLFGAWGDGSEQSFKIQETIDYAVKWGDNVISFPEGTYGVSRSLQFPRHTTGEPK